MGTPAGTHAEAEEEGGKQGKETDYADNDTDYEGRAGCR